MPDARRDGDPRFDQLIEEQAGLRRVATLVARGVGPEELFSAVSAEVGRLFGAEAVIARFEADGSAMVVVGLTGGIPVVSIGTRWQLEDYLASTAAYRTGRPARNDHTGHRDASGSVADSLRQMDFVSTVATPIVVEGRVWGVMTVSDKHKPLPPDTEERVERFTELVATAIANADSRWALGHLVEEQAALRRVAMHVARGVGPAELFNAVSVEVARLFDSEAGIARFEADGSALVFVGLSEGIRGVPVGTRWELESFLASNEAYRTGRPARSERADWQHASGPIADALKENDLGSIVSAPIVVEGERWGVIAVAETRNRLPLDAEDRLEKFTEMVATAIANAESRAAVHQLVDEQAALRRIATLVAEGSSPTVLFDAVAAEAAQVLRADQIALIRFEPGPEITILAHHGRHAGLAPVGTRLQLEGESVTAIVHRTGRPARLDSFSEADGSIMQSVPDIRTGIGTPVVVDGRVWGTITGGWLGTTPAPADAEQRLTDFAELLALAVANADSRADLAASEATAHELAREQAALRRVATLVARAPVSEQLFSTVAREIASVLDVPGVIVTRYDADGTAVTLGEAFRPDLAGAERFLGVGIRMPPDPGSLAAQVHDTHSPARIDDFSRLPGTVGDLARAARVGSGCAGPIVVNGAVWGKMCVFSRVGTVLPAGTETRLHDFIELVATAIANYEARADLAASEARARQLADEQAALRRVAMLVAEGAGAEDVFSAVAEAIEGVLDIPVVTICRCEPDGFLVIRSNGMPGFPAGSRWPWDVPSLPRSIYETGRPARIDDFTNAAGLNAAARDAGVNAAVGVPIVVGGTVWGSICAATTRSEPFPPDAEHRLGQFRELVVTFITNTIMREELRASRARVIAAADDARRRIERDLHDGAQQRLVTLAVALRRAEAKIPTGLDELTAEVMRVAEGLTTAVEELRELSRGIHPSILTEGGLSPALKALGRRSPVRVKLDIGFEDRLPDHVEVAAYYTVSEALANASKHAEAMRVWISLGVENEVLHLSIRDDGVGGADPTRGSGLTGLSDRIEALGGNIQIVSPPGGGTAIDVQIPILEPRVVPQDRSYERPSPTRAPGASSGVT